MIARLNFSGSKSLSGSMAVPTRAGIAHAWVFLRPRNLNCGQLASLARDPVTF